MRQTHYHQTPLPKLQTRELSLEIASYAPYQKIPNHSHETAFFCMALEGFCSEIYRSKMRTYEPSFMSFLPPGETHSLKFYETGVLSFSIEIKLPLLERMRECSLNFNESVHCRSGQLTQLYTKAYHEFCQMDDVSPLVVEGLVLEMLAEVSRRRVNEDSIQPPRWLKAVTEIIHDQFSEHLILNDIAESAGVHPVYLSRVFRRHYRCTIGDYIRRLRVEYASQQMLTTKAPLLEIAMAAGFSDQSHFSRIFKRQMGITPTGYRAIHSKS
ncbi:MAG: AraC family transcriptional regulator [Acidobacteria bacterium]|nr:AraC family transcriptional regulator [Acidobacteriota bacterium]MCA1638372.1 AraC family transcriptional regulator [Acidobacteriota bacterium]